MSQGKSKTTSHMTSIQLLPAMHFCKQDKPVKSLFRNKQTHDLELFYEISEPFCQVRLFCILLYVKRSVICGEIKFEPWSGCSILLSRKYFIQIWFSLTCVLASGYFVSNLLLLVVENFFKYCRLNMTRQKQSFQMEHMCFSPTFVPYF